MVITTRYKKDLQVCGGERTFETSSTAAKNDERRK